MMNRWLARSAFGPPQAERGDVRFWSVRSTFPYGQDDSFPAAVRKLDGELQILHQ